MYSRPDDHVDDLGAALNLLGPAPFVQLVSADEGRLAATGLPMLVDADVDLDADGPRLIGHLARANRHWRALDGTDVLAIVPLSDAYVSPSWYPSKGETNGRVVPTWNYEVVHLHGTAAVHEDPIWLLDLVTRLSDLHEGSRTDGGQPWKVTDAPPDFIDQMLRGIVGVSVEIDRVEAKQKLGSNRSVADQRGVLDGLRQTHDTPERLPRSTMAALDSRSATDG